MAIGDHLRDVQDLYGSPKCPHTNAVLIAAGEKGEIGRATSELQSHSDLVCRLLLEKKKIQNLNAEIGISHV